MKNSLILTGVFLFLFVFPPGIRAQTNSGFPDLTKFQTKMTCTDNPPRMKVQKVVVELYLLDKNEFAADNQLVTLITMKDTGKQFAAWLVINNADSADPKKIKISRRVFVKYDLNWLEISNPDEYIRKVWQSAPSEYLEGRYGPPTTKKEAYMNLLRNSDCSLHGPIG